jgi:hypothetical protein
LPTLQQFYSVGTTPVKILERRSTRNGWRVTMFSSGIVAGNTGRVHLGRGYVPNSVVGDPNSGDILVQGSEMSEAKAYKEEEVYTGEIWALGSIAAQQISVEEEVPSS